MYVKHWFTYIQTYFLTYDLFLQTKITDSAISFKAAEEMCCSGSTVYDEHPLMTRA